MPWIFEYDGKSIDIEDLPLSVYADIQKETGTFWAEVGASPFRNPQAALMLIDACSAELGVEVPTVTPKTLVTLFRLDETPNRPEQYQDKLPDPKAADSDQATT